MAGPGQPADGSRGVVAGMCQPLPPPAMVDEFVVLVASGVLVDLTGRPLVWTDCGWCGCRVAVGRSCPTSFACPLPGCGACAGRRRCRRLSGHDAVALHRARIDLAHQVDEDRIAAGLAAFLAAPWPPMLVRQRGGRAGSGGQLDLFASIPSGSRP